MMWKYTSEHDFEKPYSIGLKKKKKLYNMNQAVKHRTGIREESLPEMGKDWKENGKEPGYLGKVKKDPSIERSQCLAGSEQKDAA